MLRRIRALIERKRLERLKLAQFDSLELRELFLRRHEIEVGMYSYGCFDRSRFDPNLVVGRYCSISNTAVRFGRNHPTDKITMHPYFYNKSLGIVEEEPVPYSRCVIGDDVWLGGYSIILPKVTRIGRGAVVGAGAVVTRDVPNYAIVVGNPSRTIGYRFSQPTIEWIEESRWWQMDICELLLYLKEHPDHPLNPMDFPDDIESSELGKKGGA